MPLRYSSETVDVQTDAVCALLDDGYLQIFDGEQPDDGDEASTDSVLLVELRFGTPAFQSSTTGVAMANPMEMGTARATGNASWLRALKSDHTSVVFDGNVGTSGAVLNLDRTHIQINANVLIGDFSYRSPKT